MGGTTVSRKFQENQIVTESPIGLAYCDADMLGIESLKVMAWTRLRSRHEA